MRITKKLFYFLVAMFATVMLFNSCNDDDDDDDSSDKNLYLGAILFLDADDGEMHKDAVNFAVGEINDAGGLLDGYNLKLDIRSSEPQGDNDRATQAALVAEDVIKTNPNTIGFITSGSSGAKGIVEEVGNTYKIGSISGWSSANSNSGLSSYFHRTCPPNKYNIDILVQEAWNYGLKKIAVAKVEGDEWSSSFEASFREKWIAKGGTMADTVSFKENDTEYSTKLATLYSGQPDAVLALLTSISPEFYAAVNTNKATLGLNDDELVFVLGSAISELLTTGVQPFMLGETAGGVPKAFSVVPYANTDDESFKHFQSAMSTTYSRDYISYGFYFYDAVYLFALAAERAAADGGDVNNIEDFRQKVNAKIREISKSPGDKVKPHSGWAAVKTKVQAADVDYDGAGGNCNINESGDCVTYFNLVVINKKGDNTYEYKTINNVIPEDVE